MADDCIFCRIVAGQVPAARVCEDADTVAFLDIAPVVKGHTLVIPRLHCDPITGAPPAVLQKVILTVQKVAGALFRGLGADGLSVTQANGKVAGQAVPHLHFHVIPRFESHANPRNWTPGRYEDPEEMRRLAAQIAGALG